MFKVTSVPYINAMVAVVAPYSEKMFVGAVAVAASIVEHLDLPTSEVESPVAYYSKNMAGLVRDQISIFNECTPIDTARCVEVTKKFWLFRYNVLYGTTPYVGVEGDFFCGYLQCGLQFSPNEIELMNKHAVAIALLQNHIRSMINQETLRAVPSGVTVVKTNDTSIVERMSASY